MGSSTPATTNTSSQSSPWTAATPLLQNIIQQYGGLNTGVTGQQSDALSSLNLSAGQIPNFGGTGSDAISKILGQSTDAPQLGMLGQGYDSLKANLGATASGANLNPYSTPGFSDALGTLTNDITNSVKGQYAGSGRDPSGAGSFAQSLGRGLTQGEAPVVAAQANQNTQNWLNANNALYNASGTTAAGETAAQTGQTGNLLAGLQGAGMIPSLYTAPGAAQLGAANAAQAQPFTNMSPLLTAGLGLGALGTNTTGVSTQTPANNPLMNWLGGGAAAAGLMFSDENVKEDIHKVGELDDGQNVYTYRYKGSDTPQLGLLAQEVLEHAPEAVHDVGGVLAVDYSLATRRARRFSDRAGMLDLEAA